MSSDLEVSAAIDASGDYQLLYAAGQICGYATESCGWILSVYVGIYPQGEYCEVRASRGDIGVRLTGEPALRARAKLPETLPIQLPTR